MLSKNHKLISNMYSVRLHSPSVMAHTLSVECASLWIWINPFLSYHFVSHWIPSVMRHLEPNFIRSWNQVKRVLTRFESQPCGCKSQAEFWLGLSPKQAFGWVWVPANLEPVCCSMSGSSCCFLTCIQISQEAGKMVWYSHLLKNFPQFIVIYTVKGFGVINKAGVGVFLEKAMATHSSTLAWRIPWMEEPGGLQSIGSLRVEHDWATSFSLFTFMHWRRKWQPTPVFLPGDSQGQRSLLGCHLWGRTESDMTDAT